ncbi:GNAT family N-acetyltransferase [Paucibacter sp. DJ2R-2]|uniref:GNAT family N-acetyltransferase n=1 Tax=Paucibacter sp. DJ2R-2 TaxID=2893558 RepID=UPI0021E3A180|nr:GNAT family N-acetyltransferase [Paucibacter sp. DJ2R-2]MCV2423679.1 GNAT family N-acetyltransferase [Paucibacter sp. DJ4R-1]MCV2441520.1 GNAT family N-acetyltransferase [Paucibacter sp. DJ2R-2]
MSAIHIRPIDPASEAEIERVAKWMRATLIEVEGEATGTALYSMDWLRERVRWHLDSSLSTAAVLLAEDASGNILGHTIVRRESRTGEDPFGLISTTFVDPVARRLGIANLLLATGEQWFAGQGLSTFATWTSSTNTKLIQLYEKHGYSQTETHLHETTGTIMVRLAKSPAPHHEG